MALGAGNSEPTGQSSLTSACSLPNLSNLQVTQLRSVLKHVHFYLYACDFCSPIPSSGTPELDGKALPSWNVALYLPQIHRVSAPRQSQH